MSGHTARRKKEKEDMSHFEKFVVTEGNEKAEDLTKTVAMVDEGFMAEARVETMQQEREGGVRSFAVCSQQRKDCEELKPKPKEKWIFVDQKKRGDETSNGVSRGNQQVSVHEV